MLVRDPRQAHQPRTSRPPRRPVAESALLNWGCATLENAMLKQKLVDDVSAKLSEILAASPAKDMEKNLKAGLSGMLARLDLVTREEYEVQAQVLARTREKLAELEARVARLENPEAGTGG